MGETVALWLFAMGGRCNAYIPVRLVADDESEATEAVGDYAMMARAAFDLVGRVRLLEFMTVAPEALRADELLSRRLVAREDGRVPRELDIECKCFEAVSR